MNMPSSLFRPRALFAALLTTIPLSAEAGPWLEPGNPALRDDVQRLADARLLDAPVSSWPLYAPDLRHALRPLPKDASPALRTAHERLSRVLERSLATGPSRPEVAATVATNRQPLAGFEGPLRSDQTAYAQIGHTGPHLAAQVRVGWVDESSRDEHELRLDESYVSGMLGNWSLTLGQQSRWWGPGHDGSLILSNHARPLPAVRLERRLSTPFQTPWLSWLGPWRLEGFLGQLDEQLIQPSEGPAYLGENIKLIGARLSFKPHPALELGLFRVAQWGGSGRPEGLDTLWDIIAGNDNDNADQPGNQLGGLDGRWSLQNLGLPLAVYGQAVGEDESGGLPSLYTALGGLEGFGRAEALHLNWRAHLEIANTLAGFYDNTPRYNTAYNHHIYRDGYRYHDVALGHPADNDARVVSIGLTVNADAGWSAQAWVRRAELNVDGAGYNPLAPDAVDYWLAGAGLNYPLTQQLDLLAALHLTESSPAGGKSETDLGGQIGARYRF